MTLLTSPRLPSVPILNLDATGSEYSRWKRNIKFALETKDTWKYCNGTFPMPMPKERPTLPRFEGEMYDTQPCLLQERRAWMRQDREVKLDIFQSLAEEVMLDVFQVGPPLLPTKCNAQQMLETLDRRFNVFEFEGYHHAFCHFLTMRVDQYASFDEFNKEFLTVLEDLHDYGQPLSNTQACSAYFSKLNCTQNPWVAKMVEEWGAQCSEPQIHDLVQESRLWPYVKPLKSKSSQGCYEKPIPENPLYDDEPELANGDAAPELSDTSTVSSKASHSKELSETTSERQSSTVRLLSKQQFDPQALREALEGIPSFFDYEQSSLNEGVGTACTTPEWLSARERIIPQPESQPALTDMPLLLLPPASLHKSDSNLHTRSRSTPTPSMEVDEESVAEGTFRRRQTIDFASRGATPPLCEHPAFRQKMWAPPEDLTVEIHPALRPITPLLQPQTPSSMLPLCSPLVLAGSQVATPKQSFNRSCAQSIESSTSNQDSVSNALFSTRFDYSLPSSPCSSSSSNSNNNNSIVLDLPLQGTNIEPWIDSPSSCPASPITFAIPKVSFSENPPPPRPSRSPHRQPRESAKKPPQNSFSFLLTPSQQTQNAVSPIQPPISIFSLAHTTTTTKNATSLPPSSCRPQPPTKRRTSMHERLSNTRPRSRSRQPQHQQQLQVKEKEKEKEKRWSLGVSKMARLGMRGAEV